MDAVARHEEDLLRLLWRSLRAIDGVNIYGSHDLEKDHSRILFSKSTDGGENWSEPLKISQFEGDCEDDDNTTEGAVPAIGPNGEIYVSEVITQNRLQKFQAR